MSDRYGTGAESQCHIAGPPLMMNSPTRGRVVRQRCLWCGALVDEMELDRIQTMDGRPPATWEPGAVVRVEDGNPRVSSVVDVGPDEQLPDDSCANLDYGVTA